MVVFTEILWDTNDEQIDLPKKCNLLVADNEAKDIYNIGADILSDKYGYCVKEFLYEVKDVNFY